MRILIAPMAALAEMKGSISRARALAIEAKKQGHDIAFCAATDPNYLPVEEIKNYPAPLSSFGLPLFIGKRVFKVAQILGIQRRKRVRSFEEVLHIVGAIDRKFFPKDVYCLRKAIREFRPDVVYSEFRISAIVAAEMENVSIVTSYSFPVQKTYACNLQLPAWIVPFQILRGVIWGLLAVLVVKITSDWKKARLVGALLFSVLMATLLLVPSPYMPAPIRMAHFVEVLLSNFLFGLLVVSILNFGVRKMRIEIKEIDETNVDDMISVCKPSIISEAYKKGVEIKRVWLLEMLRTYGDVGFVAYFNGKPAAQLLTYLKTYLEKADPTSSRQKNVLVINCIYNPLLEAQMKRIAQSMVKKLIEKARGKYEFLVTHAFNTWEFLSQAEFFKKLGFKMITKEDLYYSFSRGELKEPYSGFWKDGEEYQRSDKDIGKVIIFYVPVCQFTYLWAYKAGKVVEEMSPELEIEVLNEWKHPEKFVSKGRNWMVVNSIPIKQLPIEREKFKKAVEKAITL